MINKSTSSSLSLQILKEHLLTKKMNFQEEVSPTQDPLQNQTMDLKEAIREEESIIVDDTKEDDE